MTNEMQQIRNRLTEQGAHDGTLDAFAKAAARVEDQAIAESLRSFVGRGALRDVDPAVVELIADQIARFRA